MTCHGQYRGEEEEPSREVHFVVEGYRGGEAIRVQDALSLCGI